MVSWTGGSVLACSVCVTPESLFNLNDSLVAMELLKSLYIPGFQKLYILALSSQSGFKNWQKSMQEPSLSAIENGCFF